MALDRYGPRRVFSVLMVLMALPTFVFAFGDTREVLFVSRLVLSSIGASFVVGIHMTALWFKPRDIGFAEGFYAGWGNFGSAAAAMTLPTIALTIYGGDDGWRYAIATSGVVMAAYGIFYWFAITDGPTADTHKKPRKASALEVSSWRDLILLCIFIVPMVGILSILVYRIQLMGYIDPMTAVICYIAIAVVVTYQIVQAIRVNVPILKKGVPEDDKYPFTSVAALNATYFANFGAELAVVSMLPMFFEETWGLTAAAAGLIAASFAFVNLFARPMGGLVSDRFGNRRFVMLAYMFGIGVRLRADGASQLQLAADHRHRLHHHVQLLRAGGRGCDLRDHPLDQAARDRADLGHGGGLRQRRRGLLPLHLHVRHAAAVLLHHRGGRLPCLADLPGLAEGTRGRVRRRIRHLLGRPRDRPRGAGEEADRAELATLFAGSEKVELAERGSGLQLTARFRSIEDVRAALERLQEPPGKTAGAK
jgi:MFS transporter, NNP family, nitrate/nitrite transporter